MKSKQVFTYSILIVLICIIYYTSTISGVLEFISSIITYTLLFYIFHIIWSKIRRKETKEFIQFCHVFMWKLDIFTLFIIIGLGSFAYYQNEINPAPMPEFTITNGDKTIVFQSMSHIGTQKFYDTVGNNIKEKKQDGYVYYFEGVKPGTKENENKFNQAIGIQFDKELYKNFSKLYGVVHQDNNAFIGLINNEDYNIDLSLDEIVAMYEEKKAQEKNPNTIIDANKQIIEALAGLNDKQLAILRYVNKSILNFIMKSEKLQHILTQNIGNGELFDVILNERNEVLAKQVISSKHQKIYITYGLLHFKGFYELLTENDSRWFISGKQKYFPIQ